MTAAAAAAAATTAVDANLTTQHYQATHQSQDGGLNHYTCKIMTVKLRS
jgi:hypothetical protein